MDVTLTATVADAAGNQASRAVVVDVALPAELRTRAGALVRTRAGTDVWVRF